MGRQIPCVGNAGLLFVFEQNELNLVSFAHGHSHTQSQEKEDCILRNKINVTLAILLPRCAH